MRGLGKFFFGGILGAIFGFLVSPKRAQRVREALFTSDLGDSRDASPQLMAPVSAPGATVTVEPRVSPAPEPEPESAAEPAAEPAAESAASEYVPPAVTSVEDVFHLPPMHAEDAPEYIPPAYHGIPEAVEAGPVFTAALADAPPAEPPVLEDAAEAAPAPPEDATWADESAPADEVASEAPTPEVVDQPAYHAEEAPESPAPVVGTTDLKARIEETRRRIQRELEQPFVPGATRAEPAAAFASEPVFEPFADEPGVLDGLEAEPSIAEETSDAAVGVEEASGPEQSEAAPLEPSFADAEPEPSATGWQPSTPIEPLTPFFSIEPKPSFGDLVVEPEPSAEQPAFEAEESGEPDVAESTSPAADAAFAFRTEVSPPEPAFGWEPDRAEPESAAESEPVVEEPALEPGDVVEPETAFQVPSASAFEVPSAPAFEVPSAPAFEVPAFRPEPPAFEPEAPAFEPEAPAFEPEPPAFEPEPLHTAGAFSSPAETSTSDSTFAWPADAPVAAPAEAPEAYAPESEAVVEPEEAYAPEPEAVVEPEDPMAVEAPVEPEEPLTAEAPEIAVEPLAMPARIEEDSEPSVPGDGAALDAQLSDEAEVDRIIGEEEAADNAPPGSGDFDHEAMRRRIEETRNRLKAKAFDAMMKGESVLLSRDAGEASDASAGPGDAAVDSEVAETIDTTLTEEDV